MNHSVFFKIYFCLFLILSSCTQNSNKKGSEKNPIQVALIPSKEANSLLLAGNEFKDWMEKETGYSFNVVVPNNYVAVIESIGSKKADIAFLTTSSYALAHKKYQVEAQYISIGKNGTTTYKGQFIVKTDSKIKKLSDIQGKKIAYVDAASASGYILPAHLLKSKNIKPAEIVFAGKHDSVVSMVYQGQVDVGATFYTPPDQGQIEDARRLVLTQYPDVEKKIRILDFTEELPNDALVFRRDLDAEIKTVMNKALEKWAMTPQGIKNLRALNNGVGLKKVTDIDYAEALKLLEGAH
jgi:phosphonate transport system substrate-binding protein